VREGEIRRTSVVEPIVDSEAENKLKLLCSLSSKLWNEVNYAKRRMFFEKKGVDLIHLTHAKLKLPLKPLESHQPIQPHPTQTKTPERMHSSCFRARKILEAKKRLNFDDWLELSEHLNDYLENTSKRVIVLKLIGWDIFKFLRYEHHFTKERLKAVLKDFETAWKIASQKYKVGVFITLTMNPATYSNLIKASSNISKALNRFMSYLRKLLGFRPAYISVLEPQDSGNPHLHVVIFGIKRIKDHYKLTEILEKQGFGPIHFEYKIRNDNEK